MVSDMLFYSSGEESKTNNAVDQHGESTHESQTHNYSKPHQPSQQNKMKHLLNPHDNSAVQQGCNNAAVGDGCQEAPLDLTTPIVPVSVNEIGDEEDLERAIEPASEANIHNWMSLIT